MCPFRPSRRSTSSMELTESVAIGLRFTSTDVFAKLQLRNIHNAFLAPVLTSVMLSSTIGLMCCQVISSCTPPCRLYWSRLRVIFRIRSICCARSRGLPRLHGPLRHQARLHQLVPEITAVGLLISYRAIPCGWKLTNALFLVDTSLSLAWLRKLDMKFRVLRFSLSG